MARNQTEYSTRFADDDHEEFLAEHREAQLEAIHHFTENLDRYCPDPELASELRAMIANQAVEGRASWMQDDPDKRQALFETFRNFQAEYAPPSSEPDGTEAVAHTLIEHLAPDHDPEDRAELAHFIAGSFPQSPKAPTREETAAEGLAYAIIHLGAQDDAERFAGIAEGAIAAHTMRDADTFHPQTFDAIMSDQATRVAHRFDDFVGEPAHSLANGSLADFQDRMQTLANLYPGFEKEINNGGSYYYMGQNHARGDLQDAKSERFYAFDAHYKEQPGHPDYEDLFEIVEGITDREPGAMQAAVDFISQQSPGDQHLLAHYMAQIAIQMDGTALQLEENFRNDHSDGALANRLNATEAAVNQYRDSINAALQESQEAAQPA